MRRAERRAERAGRIARALPDAQRSLPGWLATQGGIDAAIEAGTLPDPFYGNYRLLPQQNVVVVAAAKQRRYRVDALASRLKADRDGVYEMTTQAAYPQAGEPADDRRIAVACADFDADGREEIAWVEGGRDGLRLVLARAVDGIGVESSTPLPFGSAGEVALVSGVFYEAAGPDGPLRPQLALARVGDDARVHIELYTVDARLNPARVGGLATPDRLAAVSDRFAFAAGDVDGAGLDALALGIAGPATLTARLYRAAPDGSLTAYKAAEVGPVAGERGVALAFGDFDDDAVEELAVVWERTAGRVSVQLMAATEDHALVAPGTRWDDDGEETKLTGAGRLAATAGGLALAAPASNAPKPAQLVVGYQVGEHCVALRLFQTDQQLNLGSKYLKANAVIGTGFAYSLVTYDLLLRCGNLAGGALNTVVVGTIGTSRNPMLILAGYATVTVGAVPVAPDLSRFGAFESTAAHTDDQAQDKAGRFRLGLVLGDLTGASVRVGPPRRFQVDTVNQVMAVLNAPPAHVVRADGEEPDNVNFDGAAVLDFTNSSSQETSLTSELRKDWGYSSELRAVLRTPILELDASLSRQYGEHFDRVSSDSTSVRLSLGKDQLWNEDAVVMSTTSYTAWEYDVYDSMTARPTGKMAVVFPANRPPRMTIRGGKDILFDYFARHSVGDVLSYRTVDELPDDYTVARTLGSVELHVGASASRMTVNWESTEGRSETRSTDQSVTLSARGSVNPLFRGIMIGISASVDGTYSEGEMTSVSTKLEKSTELSVSYYQIQALKWGYAVEPLVYWSKQWGYLVVDYLVTVPVSDRFPTAWQEVYGERCDLGFALPWADGSKGPDYVLLTRDVQLTRTADRRVKAEVTVRNSSLTPAAGVRVDLYEGPPEKGVLLHTETLPFVAARSAPTFAFTWPVALGELTVWAVIDPLKEQPDLFRENNAGWSRIVIDP
jgi:hypothetical protein